MLWAWHRQRWPGERWDGELAAGSLHVVTRAIAPCAAHSQPCPPTHAAPPSSLSSFPVRSGSSSQTCCLLGIAGLSSEVQSWLPSQGRTTCRLHRFGRLQSLYCWGLCKNSTSSHLPPAQDTGETWWPGNPDYFISLGLSQVLRQCTGLHCPGCINLSVSSLFFIEMSPVQVTANIPRKSRLGLLTSAPVCS